MTKTDLETLKSTGKLTASSETFTSPTLTYIKNTGYNGTIVKFQMKTGTIEKLKRIGTVKKIRFWKGINERFWRFIDK